MSLSPNEVDERIGRLHSGGVVDMHFDLLMDLYEKRARQNVLRDDFLRELKAGDLSLVAAAIYIEDRYLPERALRVGLDQVARLYRETDANDQFAICRSYIEIESARAAGKIALVISMEGVEPIGDDLDLLRVFFELGLRMVGLTHARPNAAGSGGIFAASGSTPAGLTSFGREVVHECERLGIAIDLAHINPKGFDDIVEMTTKPLIVSHTNARRYYDIERNISDDQIKVVGQRGGVIGVNAVLVSATKSESTIDRFIDHIEHIAAVAGIDAVGIGFDFFEFIWKQWSQDQKDALAARLTRPHLIPDLRNHSHARNVTRRLIERGFSDEQIEKILRGNWLRILRELL